MKLKNKISGEIKEFSLFDGEELQGGATLKSLAEEWEDYEEPKKYWIIYGNQVLENECDGVIEDRFKEIGNYFETREEAEKAVEKLKAWKRLKDNWWLKPENWHRVDDDTIAVRFGVGVHIDMPIQEDLGLLFGGE